MPGQPPPPAIQMRKGNQPTEKVLLSLVIKKGIEEHDCIGCLGEEELILGPMDNYTDDTERVDFKCPYWVQDGMVLLTVACPGDLHSSFAFGLNRYLGNAFEQWQNRNGLPRRSVICRGDAKRIGLVNVVGYGTEINKEPDGSFSLGKNLTNQQVNDPFMTVEVASRHESHHVLFCEASAWLNEFSNVQYVLIVKISSENGGRVLIYLCRKNLVATLAMRTEKPHQGKCTKAPSKVPEDIKEIEAKYGLEIVHMYDIRGPLSESDQVILNVMMSEVLASAGISLQGIVTLSVEIDLGEVIRAFFDHI